MKVKRLLALVLALVLVFALAVPAFADETDTAENYASCLHDKTQTTITDLDSGHNERVDYCSYHNGVHNHFVKRINVRKTCLYCGAVLNNYNATTSECPYA